MIRSLSLTSHNSLKDALEDSSGASDFLTSFLCSAQVIKLDLIFPTLIQVERQLYPGAVLDEVERLLPRVHQLDLLLPVVPGSVGDHLKLEILPKDCPEHAFVNDIHNEIKEEFEEDDLLSNSNRDSNAGEPENIVSKILSEIIDFENPPLDPRSFNNEITSICTLPLFKRKTHWDL